MAWDQGSDAGEVIDCFGTFDSPCGSGAATVVV